MTFTDALQIVMTGVSGIVIAVAIWHMLQEFLKAIGKISKKKIDSCCDDDCRCEGERNEER